MVEVEGTSRVAHRCLATSLSSSPSACISWEQESSSVSSGTSYQQQCHVVRANRVAILARPHRLPLAELSATDPVERRMLRCETLLEQRPCGLRCAYPRRLLRPPGKGAFDSS